MARMAAGGRTTAIPTTLRGPSLYATTAVRPVIREIGVFNTTATASGICVVRATARGTPGAAVTAVCEEDDSHVAIATPYTTHTADATVGAPMRQSPLGASIGSGIIWTFGGNGLIIDNLTTAGVVLTAIGGVAGQLIDWYIEWDE